MKGAERLLIDFTHDLEHPHKNHAAEVMIEKAMKLGAMSDLGLRTIVDALVESTFRKQQLLGNEFLLEFKKNKIADILVKQFIHQLPRNIDSQIEKYFPQFFLFLLFFVLNTYRNFVQNQKIKRQYIRDKGKIPGVQADAKTHIIKINADTEDLALGERTEAKAEIRNFVAEYAKDNGKSLDSFLGTIRKAYPTVDLHELWEQDVDLGALLADQIEQAAELITTEKYKSLFKKNPKDFIRDFIFRRVIKVSPDGNLQIEKTALKGFLEFLDEQNYTLEDLNPILYETLYQMHNTLAKTKDIQGTTKSIRALVGAVATAEKFHLLDHGLDFDRLWEKNFVPEIKELRARKFSKKKLRLIDITRINPEGMREVILPDVATRPLEEKLQIISDSEIKFAQFRRFFNYRDEENERDDERMAKLDDQEIENLLSDQLSHAKRTIQYIMSNGLKMRDASDQIHEDCKFIPEILECKKVEVLLTWTAQPETFKQQYPQYEHTPHRIVAHFARKMLEFLLLYRKHIFKEEFKALSKDREVLEDFMIEGLHIYERKEVSFERRTRVCIDPHTHQPIPGAPYEISFEQELLTEQPNDEYIRQDPVSKLWYCYYPVEVTKFQEVKARIPVGKNGETHEATLLIYSGDGNLIHKKGEESYLSSILREKQPSDKLRWTVVCKNEKDQEVFKNFLYENHSSGHFEVIKDNEEKRNMSAKMSKSEKTEGSANFGKERDYSGATYATLAGRTPDGIEHTHIGFETQIMGLEKLLLATSMYTPTSHSHAYTPEREFENLFQYLFPPAIFGEKFAKYRLQGYRNQNGNLENNGNGHTKLKVTES